MKILSPQSKDTFASSQFGRLLLVSLVALARVFKHYSGSKWRASGHPSFSPDRKEKVSSLFTLECDILCGRPTFFFFFYHVGSDFLLIFACLWPHHREQANLGYTLYYVFKPQKG